MFVRLREYEVPRGRAAEFTAAYASDGPWGTLFGRAAGFLGTELYRDAARADRFLTIDRWQNEEDWQSFLHAYGPAYESLDAQLEGLAGAERLLFEGSSEQSRCRRPPGAPTADPLAARRRYCLSGPGGDAEGAFIMVDGTRSVPVLISGCSSGIGRAAAISLHAAGLTVYATARQVGALADLAGQGIHTLALDVTEEASMTDAVAAVEHEAGPVGVLVNNAGYGLYGPVEQLPMDEIRRQFETNFFGLVRLTQLVLPGMRRRGRGRILNVSSMGGRITLPGGAFYHAYKYAVEAFSNALRMEVAQFGIDVVLIEPGPVKTPWNDVAAASLATAAPTGAAEGPAGNGPGGSPADGDPYATYKAAVGASFARTQAGLVGRFGSTSEDVARVITQAVTARRPRARYLINSVAKSLVAMNQVLPARAYDSMIRRQYGIPR